MTRDHVCGLLQKLRRSLEMSMSIRRSPAEMTESSGVTAEHSTAEHSAGDVCGPHCLVLHVPRWLCLLCLSLCHCIFTGSVRCTNTNVDI